MTAQFRDVSVRATRRSELARMAGLLTAHSERADTATTICISPFDFFFFSLALVIVPGQQRAEAEAQRTSPSFHKDDEPASGLPAVGGGAVAVLRVPAAVAAGGSTAHRRGGVEGRAGQQQQSATEKNYSALDGPAGIRALRCAAQSISAAQLSPSRICLF